MNYSSVLTIAEIGNLETFSPVELEVVMHITSKGPSGLDEARNLFAEQVVRSCQLMMMTMGGMQTDTDHSWTMHSIEVVIQTTQDHSPTPDSRVFDCTSLSDELHGQQHSRDLHQCISRAGHAVIDAGVLMFDRSSRLKKKHLKEIFDSLLRGNTGG